MSYGPSIAELFRRLADYVDKIFRGTKPSEIPVEQPTTIELAINLRTARSLGLEVPATLLNGGGRGDRITSLFAALHSGR
jgi:putative ABC transport system substrate-binding protein